MVQHYGEQGRIQQQHVSLVESSAVVSSLAPLFMSHLKLTVKSLKVADGKLSERRFCWLVVVEVDNICVGRGCGVWH